MTVESAKLRARHHHIYAPLHPYFHFHASHFLPPVDYQRVHPRRERDEIPAVGVGYGGSG